MKVFKKILNIFSYVLAALLVFVTLWAVINNAQGKELSFFGNKFYVVKTDSMEPTIKVNTVIHSKDIDNTKLAKGEVITFTFASDTNIPNTHRIIGYYFEYKKEDKMVKESTYDYDTYEEFIKAYPEAKLLGYRTQGDNPDCKPDLKPVLFEDIRGVYQKNLVVISFIYRILSNFFGFLILIILPLLILLISQIISVAKAHNKLKLEKELQEKEEENKALEEKIKEEAIKEYLEKQKDK